MATDRAATVERGRTMARGGLRRARAAIAGGPARFAVIAALALVGLYLLYVVAANTALWARVLPDYLDENDENVRIHYASAWTSWPGHVSVDDLRVAHQDSGLETEYRATTASASISLLPLLSKQVVISDLVATDVSVRVRGRRAADEARAAQASLPPMVTWGPLAIEAPGPPPDTDPSKLWHVALDGVEANVGEIWIEGVRLTGAMAVSGSFDLMPMRLVIVDDVRLRVEDGRVEAMGEEEPLIARRVEGALRFHVAGFDAVSHEAADLLRHADVDLDATAHVFGGRIAPAMGDTLEASDGSGPMEVRLAARQGRLQRGSTALYDTAHLRLRSEDVEGHVDDLHVAARATSDEEVEVHAEAASVTARVPAVSSSRLYVEEPSGSLRLRLAPDFMHPSVDGGELSIPASNMSLVGLDGASDSISVAGGIGYLRASGDVDDEGTASGEVHVLLADVAGAVHGVELQGRSRWAIELEEVELGGDLARILATATVDVEDLAMQAGDEAVKDWSAHLEMTSFLTRRGDAPWAIDAEVTGQLRDTRPAVAILDGGGFVPGIIADQLVAEGFEVEGKIEKRGHRLQIDVEDAKGDGLRVRGRLVKIPDDLRASFLVESLLDVGVSVDPGGTEVKALADEAWLARERRFLERFATGAPGAARNR